VETQADGGAAGCASAFLRGVGRRLWAGRGGSHKTSLNQFRWKNMALLKQVEELKRRREGIPGGENKRGHVLVR